MNSLTKTDKGQSLVARFSDRFHVDAEKMLPALKATAFKQKNSAPVSDEQMLMLLVVADQHNLNPFTKEIYAFPNDGGIIPIVGVDGWARIINDHPDFNGMDFNESENKTTMPDGKDCPEWIECVIHRKGREYPTGVKEYIDEAYRPKRGSFNGPWQTHTKRMLRHKAMIQCARLAFSFSGVYDQDEAERIIEGEVIESVESEEIIMPEETEQEQSADE